MVVGCQSGVYQEYQTDYNPNTGITTNSLYTTVRLNGELKYINHIDAPTDSAIASYEYRKADSIYRIIKSLK